MELIFTHWTLAALETKWTPAWIGGGGVYGGDMLCKCLFLQWYERHVWVWARPWIRHSLPPSRQELCGGEEWNVFRWLKWRPCKRLDWHAYYVRTAVSACVILQFLFAVHLHAQCLKSSVKESDKFEFKPTQCSSAWKVSRDKTQQTAFTFYTLHKIKCDFKEPEEIMCTMFLVWQNISWEIWHMVWFQSQIHFLQLMFHSQSHDERITLWHSLPDVLSPHNKSFQ